jgi:hypothetical protein
LYWRGIIHDWSKFRPSEFFPYAHFFYNADGSQKQKRDRTGYYKPDDTGDANFDRAWFLHQKRNSHHWQWYVLPTDGGGVKPFEMSDKDRREMVCDWHGAGRAQKSTSAGDWYAKNKDKLVLGPRTRAWVECRIARI